MRSTTDSIFISIAAYRDPQLVPTVLDCVRKADAPERLRFGICWQHGEEEEGLPFACQEGFRVIDVNWRESKGACWARAEVMKLWREEDWFLQVDSHCRFVQGWDTKLLQAAQITGSEKPILSTYATPFTPGANEVLRGGPLQSVFQAFTPEGIPQLRPASLKNRRPDQPVRARFVSAGFLFTLGRFVQEVPYDPELYFMGEEIAMTVRAFTHGYDVFHPAETIVWHDYLRLDARKHWGDHTEAGDVAQPWGDLDIKSKNKVQHLLLNRPLASFGLGPVRSLQEYEAYAGLSFRLRRAQRYTLLGEAPPNPPAPSDWAESIYPWIVKVQIERSQLSKDALSDPAVWYLNIQDAEGAEICQIDIPPEKLAQFREGGPVILAAEFFSDAIPAAWTLWPLSRSSGWLGKIAGRLKDGDFAILQQDSELETGN